MKTIAFLLVILLALFSCNKKNPKGISNELYSISKDEINIYYNSKFRSEDLKNIKLSLDSFGIFIIYDSLRFDEGGYLRHISARVYNSNENTKCSVQSGSNELKDEDCIGFSYKYTHTSEQK